MPERSYSISLELAMNALKRMNKMKVKRKAAEKVFAGVISVAFLSACVSSAPTGPSVAVMPAQGKPFEVFQQDQAICKDYAGREVGIDVNSAAQSEVVQGGVAGAVLGAAAGVALGDNSRAAATGAGIGAVMGTAVGAGNAQRLSSDMQRRYDIAYEQCMYAKGNQLPQAAPSYYTEIRTVERVNVPPPPPARYPPPPPRY
jgi:hypothetical protein